MDNFQIETAQNVNISQQTAGVGERILAFIIDNLILAAYVIAVIFAFSNLEMMDEVGMVVGFTIGLPIFLYHLLWETLWNGRSPGKAALKLRVVKLDGTKPAFSNFLIRWIMRIIDISLTSGACALFTILLNGKGQRLGDIAGQTTVITEKETVQFSQTILTDIPEDYVPKYPQVTIFDDAEMQTIKNVFQDAKRNGNHKVVLKLANRISTVMKITYDEKPVLFIDKVIKDYNFYTQN